MRAIDYLYKLKKIHSETAYFDERSQISYCIYSPAIYAYFSGPIFGAKSKVKVIWFKKEHMLAAAAW